MKSVVVLSTALVSAAVASLATTPAVGAPDVRGAPVPRTPIEHVIIVVGENVSFDTLFATYRPNAGASVRNLLSQGIVDADGNPGPNYHRAIQWESQNRNGRYTVDPTRVKPYAPLPLPTLIGTFDPVKLSPNPAIPDPRFSGLVTQGPYQITKRVGYFDPAGATGDPVHRFFQMWQQTGGTNADHRGFAWVALTVGQSGDTGGVTSGATGQGAELMGFFNMAQGDAPYFRSLAGQYAISDNYHQAVMGGTGANFFALATGDAASYTVQGLAATPPANQIENPDPRPGTANFYLRDGYSGGSYVNCADVTQPGVAAIHDVLAAHRRGANCDPGTYYLVNNYSPPFTMDGTPKALGATKYVYPPQTVPTIGEALSRRSVTWRWYTGGRDVADVTGDALFPLVRSLVKSANPALPPAVLDAVAFQQTRPLLYNDIGDPLNASANVVGTRLAGNLRGLDTFYSDVAAGTLPSVSWVVPKNLDSGHPGYSAPARYELFVKTLVEKVQANPKLWATTAIVVTTDEGGGYFDTGRIQPLDFFGDGPRIPLFVISPFARRGHVDHEYLDHASLLKFIEYNWRLPPLSPRSRDRLKNPVTDPETYLPVNGPAIGDLRTLFTFGPDPRRGDDDDRGDE